MCFFLFFFEKNFINKKQICFIFVISFDWRELRKLDRISAKNREKTLFIRTRTKKKIVKKFLGIIDEFLLLWRFEVNLFSFCQFFQLFILTIIESWFHCDKVFYTKKVVFLLFQVRTFFFEKNKNKTSSFRSQCSDSAKWITQKN